MCEMIREVKSHALCRVVGIAVSLHFVLLVSLPSISKAQLAWSPIQVDSESNFCLTMMTMMVKTSNDVELLRDINS